ncbi:hypothetical protein GCK72_022046 [Caenorhabditis remanei]|uniref:HOOK N-terminal domain-containing protein n=1 Tax=Caenorhabditis remanei TaxID=31234 RepID=A0A6A5GJK4_CAERE|nr:hypothetical protein GCK72_022046 [Caenorhabditis remanei]KAF1755477.1 hypothetical protein GCK72_022046 [Caenorhabditis remanei]
MKNKSEEFFWNHPLAFWLHDCAIGDPPLIPEKEWRMKNRYNCAEVYIEEILDGLLMSSLMRYIDPNCPASYNSLDFSENGKSKKVWNQFQHLLIHINRFYETNLEQIIVCRLPDLHILTRIEFDENSQEELKKLLLLLLGCAIQSDKKKVFVERITGFNQEIQAGLARYIQQLTEGKQIVKHLNDFSRMREREDLDEGGGAIGSVEEIDTDDLESTTTTSSNGEICNKHKDQSFLMSRSTSPTSETRHLSLQMANLQHEMRQLRTQAENKDEECRKLEIELEEKSRRISFLENERLKLLEKERMVKELDDDLQAARCRIEKLQQLEHMEKKFKEARDEKEMYKSRYEAVTKKNITLEEEITDLDKNLKSLKTISKNRDDMEEQLLRMKTKLKELESEVSKKNSDIGDLILEKHRMDVELKEREERILQLEMPGSTNNTPRFMDSLADQLEDAKQDEVELMKAEIRKLRAQTEGAVPDTTIIIHNQELEDLRKQLSAEQHKNTELHLEIQKLQVEREQIDGNMERIGIELEGTTEQVENLSHERDEAIRMLHEARRKFGQFQTEFGVKSDEKLRKFQCEIVSMREKEEEMEFQVGKAKEENRRLQFELDEVHEEKSQIEESLKSLERSKKSLDLEKTSLKSRLVELEDLIESQKMTILNTKVSQKRLEDRDALINSLHNQKNDLENELKTCQTHLDLESNKLQRFREDLVQEKSKRADLVGRLRSLCTTLSLNGAQFDVEKTDDEQLIASIDDVMMNALVAVKRERDDLRIQGNQQIAELHDLKRDIEKLRRSESASLNESDDRVRELTKENMNTKEQVFMLQEKLRELNLELSTKNNELDISKASIEELSRNSMSSTSNNSEIARLQVSIRNSQIQEDLVKQENSKIIEELQDLQKQNKNVCHNLDELESMHKALLVDHSRLQQLHNLLTKDYDQAKKETMELKLKVQNIPKQQAVYMNANIRELEAKLSEEISRKELQNRQFQDLEREHKMCRIHCDNLRRDITELVQTRDELSLELRRAHDTCVYKNNSIDDLKKQLSQKISEINKLNSKIDALSQLNRTYNEENKNLSRQLEILLTQNKELLQRALHDKDQYHLEMKDYQDQLSALRRHKEKLEDKIMDQYRTMENKKPTPERKQPLVKRAAKALINRRRATSNGGSTTEDSSVYSADERSSPPLAPGTPDDNDNLPPTCSSSDDHEIVSPDFSEKNVRPGMRSRNDFLGGSVRIPAGARRYLNDNENHNQSTSFLPPRVPLRNTPTTSSLRSRPPPPPYNPRGPVSKTPHYRESDDSPSRKPGNLSSLFEPIAHSTPNSSLLGSPDRRVVAEGEKREAVRDKDERIDKTLSYYENVNLPPSQSSSSPDYQDVNPNEKTLWLAYGCV